MAGDSTGFSGSLSNDSTNTSIVQNVNQRSAVSHATVARYRQAHDAALQAQEQLVKDIIRVSSTEPDTTFALLQEAKELREKIEGFTDKIAQRTEGDYTPHDVDVMRDMKSGKIPEVKIAEYFSTNQSRVNRLLNNK